LNFTRPSYPRRVCSSPAAASASSARFLGTSSPLSDSKARMMDQLRSNGVAKQQILLGVESRQDRGMAWEHMHLTISRTSI
jgi:hypothetical protein